MNFCTIFNHIFVFIFIVSVVDARNSWTSWRTLPDDINWSFQDHQTWSLISPLCGVGRRQSPINIPGIIDAPPATCLEWTGYDQSHPNMQIINDGHTINIVADWLNGENPTVRGGPLTGVYKLAQLHWHWGSDNSRGSEHTLNNTQFPAELHFVHFSEIYKSLDHAIGVSAYDPEALAVVSVLFAISPGQNITIPGVSSLVAQLERYLEEGEPTVLPDLNLRDYFMFFSGFYHSYLGSLTTPPCYEIVNWIVSRTIFPILSSDLDVFRRLTDFNGNPLSDNYRVPQPANGRVPLFYNRECLG